MPVAPRSDNGALTGVRRCEVRVVPSHLAATTALHARGRRVLRQKFPPPATTLWTNPARMGVAVTPGCDGCAMTRRDLLDPTPTIAAHHPHGQGDPSGATSGGQLKRPIRGLRLRELLVLILLRQAAPMTVAALAAAVDACGFRIDGRAGKVVSDQLRYEVARGRVRRVGRGMYVTGKVTRQARWRMQRRITALRVHQGDDDLDDGDCGHVALPPLPGDEQGIVPPTCQMVV